MERLIRTLIGLCSIAAVIMLWGAINSFTGGRTATISLASKKGETARPVLLNDADSLSKGDTADSAVLLNDPFLKEKWGLAKVARKGDKQVWNITKGSKDIVIAVIDTGIDVNHKDLRENLWHNPGESGLLSEETCKQRDGEKAKSECRKIAVTCKADKEPMKRKECDLARNKVDDDNNGFVDDVHGWNFVANDDDLTDNHGHGTHIAGIIGAKGDNGYGISGVAPNISVMVLKYYDPKASNSNNLRNTIQAIRYAIKMKANIINYSGGGVEYSEEEHAAVKLAENAGILFVAAAGNERANSDEKGKHYYPADYELSNIISVTAVNSEETVLASSNYGVRTVDLAAPGENIYSTLPGNSFGHMTGTSQATAFVTGVAALVMSHNRDLIAGDVKKYILRTGEVNYNTLLSKTGTAKLLNSYNALTMLDSDLSANGAKVAGSPALNSKVFSSGSAAGENKLNTSVFAAIPAQREQAESIAMWGKDLLKAIDNKKQAVDPEMRPTSRTR